MRVVVLVALRDIEPEEELYSTYMDIVQSWFNVELKYFTCHYTFMIK